MRTKGQAQPSLGASITSRGPSKFAVEVNAVAVRKRKAQKRYALKPTGARQPVTGGRSIATPIARASGV